VCLANFRPGKIIDVSIAAGDATHNASGRPDGHCDPIGSVDAQKPAARNSCLAPSVSCPDAFESALSAIGPSAVAGLATDLAAVEKRAGAGSAGHGRALASRSVCPALVASLTTSWKTTH
jgi:hypothetical protein